jgi:hypothetical protein
MLRLPISYLQRLDMLLTSERVLSICRNFRTCRVCVKAETETPASDILNEGKVKEGKPAPARPDEPHKYKYQ